MTAKGSQQLELALDDVRKVLPWDGRSPRALTKGVNWLFSRREPQKMTDEAKGDGGFLRCRE